MNRHLNYKTVTFWIDGLKFLERILKSYSFDGVYHTIMLFYTELKINKINFIYLCLNVQYKIQSNSDDHI